MSFFTLSNLTPKETGIPDTVVCVSAGEFEEVAKSCPRIKLAQGSAINTKIPCFATISIAKPPIILGGNLSGKLMADVFRFIELNYLTLLNYWKNLIDTKEMLNSIKGVYGKTTCDKE